MAHANPPEALLELEAAADSELLAAGEVPDAVPAEAPVVGCALKDLDGIPDGDPDETLGTVVLELPETPADEN